MVHGHNLAFVRDSRRYQLSIKGRIQWVNIHKDVSKWKEEGSISKLAQATTKDVNSLFRVDFRHEPEIICCWRSSCSRKIITYATQSHAHFRWNVEDYYRFDCNFSLRLACVYLFGFRMTEIPYVYEFAHLFFILASFGSPFYCISYRLASPGIAWQIKSSTKVQ